MSLEDAVRARRLVKARLGREPQDALEAAVVLEAWAGVPAQRALETARDLMPRVATVPLSSRSAAQIAQRPRGLALEGVAFLVTVIAIALWGEPLGDALGAETVGRAVQFALPVTVALQWTLFARHLGRPSGLAGLTRRRGALVVAGLTLVVAGRLILGDTGTLAALLVVAWVGGTLMIRRGWSAAYCAVVVATVGALELGAPALVAVATATAIIAGGALLALWPTGGGASTPGRWSRATGAGITGLGIGVLLVGDPSVSWAGGAAAALALLPSAAGALWAGHHLWLLAGAFPRALAGVPASGGGRSHREPLRIFGGGLLRLAGLTYGGSLALALLTPTEPGILVAFGLAALATLLLGLLDALGKPGISLLGVAVGVAAELAARQFDAPFSGAALCTGSVAAIAVLAPATLVLLVRPARTLATTLWVP